MNRHRGTYDLNLGDEVYTICYSINSICDLEEALGENGRPRSVTKIAEDLNDPDKLSLRFVRAFLWSGLRKHHDMSIEACGDLIEKYGLPVVLEQLVTGFVGAFPVGDGRPRTAERTSPAGNGLNS
jgi:hypothetical protein